MSSITVYSDNHPQQPLLESSDGAEISNVLAEIGVRFERWQADAAIDASSSAEDILTAYKSEIDRLVAEQGYITVDTISLASNNPAKDELRQ